MNILFLFLTLSAAAAAAVLVVCCTKMTGVCGVAGSCVITPSPFLSLLSLFILLSNVSTGEIELLHVTNTPLNLSFSCSSNALERRSNFHNHGHIPYIYDI